MLDTALRRRVEPPLNRIAARLDRAGVSPNAVTGVGFALGVGACVAVGFGRWWLGLGLWLANRLADGLDGPLARRRRPTDLGGFLDIMADFAIYGGLIVAIGVDRPDTRLACLTVFLAYYLSGSAFLAFSSLAEKRRAGGDGRSLQFPAGIAEGSETIIAMVAVLAWPAQAELLLWVWAALVGVTFLQRIVVVARLLRTPIG